LLSPDATHVAAMNSALAVRLNGAFAHLVDEVLGRDWAGDLIAPGPCAFAVQGMMREAAVAGDVPRIAQIHTSYQAVLQHGDPLQACRIVAFGPPDLNRAEMQVLQHGFRDDIGLTADLVAPNGRDTLAANAEIRAVLAALAVHLPEWSQELRALLRTIILATTQTTSQSFAGASAFDVWGAILINPAYRRDRMHLALTLVHESAHLKLFYAYLDDDVVSNPAEELFSSPLRRQPRPMNGLFHAAFVLARMALFIGDIVRAGVIEPLFGQGTKPELQAQLTQTIASFDSAHTIVAQHARLTPRGQDILAEAVAGIDQCRNLPWPT
jgi:HEXXH motif-containing protein